MNTVNISYMSKQEIESAYHQFSREELVAAVDRLIRLSEAEIDRFAKDAIVCVCNYE
jgi:hypothetical protein